MWHETRSPPSGKAPSSIALAKKYFRTTDAEKLAQRRREVQAYFDGLAGWLAAHHPEHARRFASTSVMAELAVGEYVIKWQS